MKIIKLQSAKKIREYEINSKFLYEYPGAFLDDRENLIDCWVKPDTGIKLLTAANSAESSNEFPVQFAFQKSKIGQLLNAWVGEYIGVKLFLKQFRIKLFYQTNKATLLVKMRKQDDTGSHEIDELLLNYWRSEFAKVVTGLVRKLTISLNKSLLPDPK